MVLVVLNTLFCFFLHRVKVRTEVWIYLGRELWTYLLLVCVMDVHTSTAHIKKLGCDNLVTR